MMASWVVSDSSGRALHGARGLKQQYYDDGSEAGLRRALHGARGLKPPSQFGDDSGGGVAPFTGRVD